MIAGARPIYIAGARATGDGYPNGEGTIRMLHDRQLANVIDVGFRLEPNFHLWRIRRLSLLGQVGALCKLGWQNVASLLRILRRGGRKALIYVPYPSVFFLFAVGLLPRAMRPVCIADAYISIWDSGFKDRAASGKPGVLAGCVKWVEGFALRAAAHVLVDTDANRHFMIQEFGLDAASVSSVPLAVDVSLFNYLPVRRADGKTQVLFIGTLIPLHGIEVILAAAQVLQCRRDICFTIVGDGQLSELVRAQASSGAGNFRWVREWQSLPQLATRIASADICLGVFGGAAKAARVTPFKLYYYLAAGRAIITQDEGSTPAGAPLPPAVRIRVDAMPASARRLAAAIESLADDSSGRCDLAGHGAAFYGAYLSRDALAAAWRRLLDSPG